MLADQPLKNKIKRVKKKKKMLQVDKWILLFCFACFRLHKMKFCHMQNVYLLYVV